MLAPEGVPRLLLAVEPRVDDAAVRGVHVRRAVALEREGELVPRLTRPVRPEAADDLLRVEHETDAVREQYADVALARRLRDIEPEQPVEADRPAHVARHDADRVQLRHEIDANGYRRRMRYRQLGSSKLHVSVISLGEREPSRLARENGWSLGNGA